MGRLGEPPVSPGFPIPNPSEELQRVSTRFVEEPVAVEVSPLAGRTLLDLLALGGSGAFVVLQGAPAVIFVGSGTSVEGGGNVLLDTKADPLLTTWLTNVKRRYGPIRERRVARRRSHKQVPSNMRRFRTSRRESFKTI